MPSKNIIFCADGTWNGPGEAEDHDRGKPPTNVFKLFSNLDGSLAPGTLRLADEQELELGTDGTVQQVAKYLHGVGDSDNFLVRALGGVGGAGLVTRIVRGYTFISRHYAAGDRIFILGFSRGAYTARALAGLIGARGLLDGTQLDLGDRDRAYRLGSAEWFEYRRAALSDERRLLDKLQEVAFDLPGFLSRRSTAPRVANVLIEVVAVWDTVGALGIPEFNLKTGKELDAFQFADTRLGANVRHAFHAVAVDERRATFPPTLWNDDPRVAQMLFPGAHSDVGGGYPQAGGGSALSDRPLEWFTGELRNRGVRFAAKPAFATHPNPCGLMHAPWAEPPWNLLPSAARALPEGLLRDQSVNDRLAGGPMLVEVGQSPYAPENLTSAAAGAR